VNDDAQDPFWLSPASYWQPAHIVTSAWLTHAPFAFWLIDNLRPRAVAELGSHFGFSTFVFAEAATRLRTPMRIHAVDTWMGDDHAGFYGEDVYEAFTSIAYNDYPDVVEPLRMTFADARSHVPDRELQLLHIDGRHGYDDVYEDFHGWRGAVSDGGIVLFHDIAERQSGFGVWRLWEELSAEYPSFSFEHGHGLGVLAVGAPPTPELRALFRANAAETHRIRTDYERLGTGVDCQRYLETLPAEVSALQLRIAEMLSELGERDAHIRECGDAIEQLDREVTRLNEERQALYDSRSWRITAPIRSLGRARDRLRPPD
jgi:hypothetical protein